MDRESVKREQLRSKYELCKKKVKDWEVAVSKTEGRKPIKEDMKSAPKRVQEAYRDLVKIRKYLDEHLTTAIKPANNNTTPGKIYVSRRPQLQQNGPSYLTRTPDKNKNISKTKRESPRRAYPTFAFRNLRKVAAASTSLGNGGKNDSTSYPFRPFQKLFNKVTDPKLKLPSSMKTLAERKKHNTILVKDDSNAVVERKVLIADRFLRKTESLDDKDHSVAAASNGQTDKNAAVPVSNFPVSEDSENLGNKSEVNQLTPTKVNSVPEEKVCKTPKSLKLKSPQIKNRCRSFRTSRLLDTEWLARVTEAETETTEADRKNSEDNDDGLSESPETLTGNKFLDSSGGESFSTSLENEPMDMETDSDFNAYRNTTSNEPENSDSGICVGSFFNAEDVRQAMNEVLSETSQNKNGSSSSAAVISDADGSLLYSFSEDACHPSDPEPDEFSTIDKNEISNIIMSLNNDIDDEDEASKSTHCSGETVDEDSGRKRPASFAFSPSPEKSDKKRKFFKSTKTERKKPVFSRDSYKPPSPRKRVIPRTPGSVSSPATSSAAAKKSFRSKNENASTSPVATKSARSTRSKKQINYDEEAAGISVVIPVNQAPPPPVSKRQVVDIFDEVPQQAFSGTKKGRRYLRNAGLDSKLSSGKVDENFVRIDTKRKVFVRGHRKINVVKMKRLEWKQKRSQGNIKEKEAVPKTFTCNKCGEKGHFAKFCPTVTAVSVSDIPEEQQDDSPFPTLEEAARMVYKNPSNKKVTLYTAKTSENSEGLMAEGDLAMASEASEPVLCDTSQTVVAICPQLIESLDPFFSSEENFTEECDLSPTENEEQVMKDALKEFGYDSFRSGQQEAINRVLKGLSTLLILSTGSGKSLCYQLPAYLYQKKYPGALTLCISPLVSLMEDQIQGIPPFLNAACIHSNMTAKKKAEVLEKVQSKTLHILLVSPEAVCGGLFGLLRGTNSDNLPKISFACIDEIHCVSQWSHNFRPSYLQLCKILREKLNVKTILGLTATATKDTVSSICEHLNVNPSTTIRGELIPRNLQLSVSRDMYKDEALMSLLRGERFCICDSIIIYCTRRDECERIATLIRTKFQEVTGHKIIKTKSGAKLSGSCEAYHAGMTPRRRKNVQDGFMSGAIRIVVATVAFGMGIDKSDIRAVIHYNMPKAFESYVQEIGRAGRDGLPAHCHLFLDNARRNDLCELKRHVYANSVDRPTVRKLLRKIFQPCKCKRIEKLKGNTTEGSDEDDDVNAACPGHEVSFSIDKTVMDLDLPKENITTLLCYLELDKNKWIEILPLTYEICKIQSYGGAKLIKAAATRCPPLAVAIALQQEKRQFSSTDTYLEFNVIEAAATVGWSSSIVKKELKNLEWSATQFDDKGNPTKFRKSGLLVEFFGLAWRVKSSGLSDEQADMILNSLHGRNVTQERAELNQLERVYHALLSVSFPTVNNLCDSFDEEKSDQLKKFIYDYFHESSEDIRASTDAYNAETELEAGKSEALRQSIRLLIDSNKDINFTTRSIARIFQGISSPCFPSDVWYRNRDFWRRYLDVDFHVICRVAAEEL